MSRIALVLAGLLLCASASAQVQRTFVASTGNDANTATNCGFINPCRSFTAAQTVTQSGGEIIALDAAGYGAITITKSLSILANPGVYAGISASTGNAVTIATAGVNVRLAGLKINGLGATHGIHMTNGSTLTVENCSLTGFTLNGIWVQAAAKARITDTLVAGNAQDGIAIEGAQAEVINTRAFGNGRLGIFSDAPGAFVSSVTAFNSVASQNLAGFTTRAELGTAVMTVSNSTADHNVFAGFYNFLGAGGTSAAMAVSSSKATRNLGNGFVNTAGVFSSAGNNMGLYNDGGDSSGTITNSGTM